ncbi:hypothetical protein CE91St46_08430 [Eubacteriales bacterium]|nr:hypothetical protein CE91St46_08430 [Eubacteriales bacterium]GKH62368.1 hypothetical protein CE91St47_08370 [Eubacteriales bacterium]
MRKMHTLYSPQLARNVNIYVILPESYDQRDVSYPVLYFYDGDRIYDDPKLSGVSALKGSFEFGAYRAAYGQFLPAVILVGIAPPENMWRRTAEYSPYTKQFDVPEGVNFEPHVHGRGQALGEWVVTALKPWVDAHYRTKPEAEYTGIGGLSTSGVNALYMITKYPQVFHRCVMHAPAIHLWMEKIMETMDDGDYTQIKYLYVDIGTEDCTRMVQKGEAYKDLCEILRVLKARGLREERLRFFEIYQGRHECATWQLTFPDALRWAYQDAELDGNCRIL